MDRELKREVLNYAKNYEKIIGLNVNGDYVKYQGIYYFVDLQERLVWEEPEYEGRQ